MHYNIVKFMLNLFKYDFEKLLFNSRKDNYALAGAAAVTIRGFNKDCISMNNIGSIVQEIEDEGNYICTIGTTTRVVIIITSYFSSDYNHQKITNIIKMGQIKTTK